MANKNKNNKVKPILPSSYQKKRIAIGKIKITLKKGGGRGGGGGVKVLNNYSNEYFLLCLITIHNCAISCNSFGTPKFLQMSCQHGCMSTHRTGVYCRLQAAAGHSWPGVVLKWWLGTLLHRNIQATNSIGCIQYARAFGH